MSDARPAGSEPTIYTAASTTVSNDQGKFRTNFDFPGDAVPGHDDHGYGPLATVVESFMDPGTHIRMHPHRNEEIISWVPAGVMRHDDRQGNDLVTDSDHLMVMNAGREFWHAELTEPDDPPLRMLQIFVRPHRLDLEPTIQHERLPEPTAAEWRHLVGPEDGNAPLFVRNAVSLYDCRLEAGAQTTLPAEADQDTYLYVFEGAVTVGPEAAPLGRTERALVRNPTGTAVRATESSLLVAFSIDPDAPITREGTIGR